MGIRFLEGRDFRPLDSKESPDVAIVNRKFAQHFFGDKSAIGKRIGRGGGPDTKFNVEIIGVVEDSLYEGPREGVRRQVFWPDWGNGGVAFYVRTTEASAGAFNLIRNEVKRLDAAMPVYDMKTRAGTTRRDAAHRSPDRAALGRLRAAGHACSHRSASTA